MCLIISIFPLDFNSSFNNNRSGGGGSVSGKNLKVSRKHFLNKQNLGRNDGYPGVQGTEVLHQVIGLLGGYTGREDFQHVYCGNLSNCNIGDFVELTGQLFRRNNRFAEIRDKSGVVQLIVDDERVSLL